MKRLIYQRESIKVVPHSFRAAIFLLLVACLWPLFVSAQIFQQEAKLSGSDVWRPMLQGNAVAISADGKTAVVGGPMDDYMGAVWIFTRNGNGWLQQGNKLIGTGAIGNAEQGYSVAISGDGNTILVGGPGDDDNAGAAWVFVRKNGIWAQEGEKLVGAGAVGKAAQGVSVALSADGTTALIGGTTDNNYEGATWVFVRNQGIWQQQGPKLVGSFGYEGIQGSSVAISADGNTAVIGGPNNWGYHGAAWVFVRKNGAWSQQGPVLFGMDSDPSVGLQFGRAVAISGDGNTLMIGGPWDDYWTGAVWMFARTGDTWTQQGPKLVGTGTMDYSFQGWSTALSYDGNIAICGAAYADNDKGATWVFTRNGAVWSQEGEKWVGAGAKGNAYQGWAVSLSADGTTALVGGPNDDISTGATWTYTRSSTGWNQLGEKIIGTGGTGYAFIGYSSALSADGTTALVGGYYDQAGDGAIWAFVRTDGNWTQQGPKIVGSGAIPNASGYTAAQGYSLALSADGNTALVGGPWDDTNKGAAWVFTRTNGIWSQQGNKLYGTGATGAAFQGRYVALSGDGNTALVCGPRDNNNTGAVWIYTRSNGVWTQQGSKLTPDGAIGTAYLGRSAALSYDGNTAIIGGTYDDNYTGAAWVFTRQNGIWTQQGPKLTGIDAAGAAALGVSVVLSADGNTALVGGTADNNNTGATWVFTRQNGVWTQLGGKLVGTGSVGDTYQGVAVSLSADGNKALISGYNDEDGIGALWVFVRHNGIWAQQGQKIIGTGTIGKAGMGYSASLSADGLTAIAGGIFDNSSEGAAWIFSVPACDEKQNTCLSYEIMGISEDEYAHKTYELRVTNQCDEPLTYLAVQLPNGLIARAPANGVLYTAATGNNYQVRNPNFSPFYSLRFSSVSDGIRNGAREVFRYTLPAQADPDYIHVVAKLGAQTWYEAHLNVFNCPVEPVVVPPAPPAYRDEASNVAQTGLLYYPNPTHGRLWVDLSRWDGQSVQLEVLNAQGLSVSVLHTVAQPLHQALDLHQRLPDGLYWLNIIAGNGDEEQVHFVLQRQ